jgi:hypothetical protein
MLDKRGKVWLNVNWKSYSELDFMTREPVTFDNVILDINPEDPLTIYRLRDTNIIERIEFLEKNLRDLDFDDVIFSYYKALRFVALEKGLFDKPQRFPRTSFFQTAPSEESFEQELQERQSGN